MLAGHDMPVLQVHLNDRTAGLTQVIETVDAL